MEEQIQQLRRRLNERVLERAEADPNWRQQLLDDPHTATGSIPEAHQLREMLESATPTDQRPPAEATMPPTTTAQEEYRQVQRSLTEKILDRAASDSTWKQQLLSDPNATLREADFPELKRLAEIHQEQAAEVEGQWLSYVGEGCGPTPTPSLTIKWTSLAQSNCCFYW
jgi:hypothetical protein